MIMSNNYSTLLPTAVKMSHEDIPQNLEELSITNKAINILTNTFTGHGCKQ